MEKDKQALYVEAVQDITVNCYEPLYENMEDSRAVLATIRAWATEFEDWWWSLSEEEQDRRDYLLSIDKFCERHLRAELEYGDGVPDMTPDEQFLELENNIAETLYFNS